jgi:WhiB family transcriptional regulator, redox-sensing transcriptional regulator
MTRRAVQPPLPLNIPEMPAAVREELRAEIAPGWGQQAACASRCFDPDSWFAPADDERQMVARDVCSTCPVRRSCLAQALVVNEPDGIWGGFDETERAWLRLALAEGTRVVAVLDPHSRTAAA